MRTEAQKGKVTGPKSHSNDMAARGWYTKIVQLCPVLPPEHRYSQAARIHIPPPPLFPVVAVGM